MSYLARHTARPGFIGGTLMRQTWAEVSNQRVMRQILILSVLLLSLCAMPSAALSGDVDNEFRKSMTFFVTTSDGYQTPRADQSLANLAGLGVNDVMVQATAYMDTAYSTDIYLDPMKSPSDDSLGYVIQKMRGYGLRAVLKVNFDVNDNTSRKKIAPVNWNEWWEDYRTLVLHYAGIAENNGVAVFVVGTELDSAVQNINETSWRDLIFDVGTIYSGKITYGASRISCSDNRVPQCVPGYREVSWWDALDYGGIDAWFPLTNISNPTVEQLLDAWKPWVADIEDWQLYIGKPVLFTEMGYSSYDGTNIRPPTMWNGEPLDFQEQVDTYEAAFRAFFDKVWLHGIYWWYWSVDPNAGGLSDGTWLVQGKPAQQTIQAWYAKAWPTRQSAFGLKARLCWPKDEAQMSSPYGLTLKARILDKWTPVAYASVAFYINMQKVGVSLTDALGYAKLRCSPLSGTYSWYVVAAKSGFGTGVSETWTFQFAAVLKVNLLVPKDSATVTSPVKMKVRILYAGIGVPDATVTFYADGSVVGTTSTDINGYAVIKIALVAGRHTWYAAAGKTGFLETASLTRAFIVR